MILPDVNLLVYAYNEAIEHQGELHSTDVDFRRFPGLRWTNPLA